ncbi:O-acetylhomoserine aminocarboxypropyltransferase/cysteine synthase family protein [Butyricicoccus porcorum]|uniref:O-acetylhomoserine aminocarboxypropyltransferase n=1 Tax=Butyricicoccus porcorum TaxID=1945634 RepID=A0A252F1D5_9FIRM|nr:O-acetylhomoserine aminocarboxypropyltransferase/cysteine synthase family protein [Butyricicoccus porcorum]MCI6926757.1 O-acetylhomoserine aminocarboxypropyltransferase/cysteine synthase [Butyricicoccus porcorum]MDD6986920.1 O-acetylhomoserine aminocarboxypropyltransferase/cysteine synthase [Butyricicoccus porcorum]MDY4482735.1 O-acetylhomoserine aminocarboxypropyltransferase/cysteine synthase family protein [Butyricicoccus porcorum]OUM19522.1 O-acetylhomoserine aminocarboxypropyltransferase
MRPETACIHAGYEPGNGGARALPVYQSTTFTFDSTEHVGALFDLTAGDAFYTRLGNPTVDAVEKKIAALEGGVGALCTSSGQAASMLSILNIAQAGDHILCSSAIYGGTFNLFGVTLKKLGIEVTFIDEDASLEELQALVQPNTKAVFGETIANPALTVLDIEKMAQLAHSNGIPLIVDNTFATPILCRPFDFGADIIVHSTTKYMDGHAVQMGGVIVDSGKFDWGASGKFPGLTEPDASYHGLRYTEAFGEAAYITKARVQLMRDMGTCQTPMGAFLLDLGLQTLPLRIRQHSKNALTVAEYLEQQPDVEFINYPGLASDKYHALAEKYLPEGTAGVISFSIKGGRDRAAKFIDSLKLVSLEVHVADIHSCILHPATATHRQLTDEQLVACGITPGLVRLSVGLENVEDILDDIKQAFAAIAE